MKLFAIILFLCLSLPSQAQLFKHKGMTFKQGKWEVGFGAHLGYFMFTPKTLGPHYTNQPGTDASCFFDVGYNLNKNIAINGGFGKQYLSGLVKYSQPDLYDLATLKAQGNVFKTAIKYSLYNIQGNQLLYLSAGYELQDLTYTALDYVMAAKQGYTYSTGLYTYFNDKKITNHIFACAIGKQIWHTNTYTINVFSEYALLLNNYNVIHTFVNTGTGQKDDVEVSTGFHAIRLGLNLKIIL